MATTTEPTTTDEIVIKDTGPIELLHIRIPPDGGLVVLHGANGRGKSTAISAVKRLIGGKNKLSKRDGALKGSVEGFGVKLNVGQLTTARGELGVYSIESDFYVDDLVDPPIKDPVAADAHRIKAIVGLSGAEPNLELFYPLVGGRQNFEKLCSTEPADDLPSLAARVKRQLEQHATREEEQATTAENSARAKHEAIADVDLESEADDRKLRDELETAISAKAKIAADAESAAEVRESAVKAGNALLTAQSSYKGPTPDDARAILELERINVKTLREKVERLQEELSEAESEFEKASGRRDLAESALNSAVTHQNTIAAWQKQIDEADWVKEISPEEIEAATDAVAKARERDQLGRQVREARQKKADAEAADAEALQHRTFADQLRQAGKRTNEILSDAVATLGTPLRVIDSRVVLKTSRGDTYFGELSAGERWRLALDILINAVGVGGVLAISQPGFECLDNPNRHAIKKQANGRGVLILAAQADEGELRAEIYQNGE